MKIYRFIIFIFCSFFLAPFSYGSENEAQKFPSIYVPSGIYEFKPVLEGDEVMHDYIVQNKGTAPLKIEKVKAGWGCTVVSYPRQILPGGKGKINVKVSTRGYGGRKLKKNIIVQTNDKKQPKINLTITGEVKKFAIITPQRITLYGPAGKQLQASVKIIPEKKYLFRILEALAIKGNNISCNLEEIKESGEYTYLLTVKNLKKDAGRYSDTIALKTTSKIRPKINISVYGNIINTQSQNGN